MLFVSLFCKNLFHLFTTLLIRNKWGKKNESHRLAQVYLEMALKRALKRRC